MHCHWGDYVTPGRRGQANPGARRPASGLKPIDPSRKGEAPMPKLCRLAAISAASTALWIAAPAQAAPVTVNLRVEGSSQTLYEGPVTTDAKTLTKDNTGEHPCDGTNGGKYPSPGPTVTGALDDGATAAGFTWDASWNDGYGDFFINRIGPDTNTGAPDYQPYWGYFLNGVTTPDGGCQTRVNQGDGILFAYANFGDPLLEMSGTPSTIEVGQPFTVTVLQNDGNGHRTSAAGANVEGVTTNTAGRASITFSNTGRYTFKAIRAGSVRSNAQTVCVYAKDSGDCGQPKPPADTNSNSDQSAPSSTNDQAAAPPAQPAVKDTTPPLIKLTTIADGKDYDRGPRVLAGDVEDGGGIAQVFLRLRATDSGDLSSASRCRWFSGKRGVFTHRTVPCSRARFFRIGTDAHFSYLLPSRLGHGKYVFEVKVLDKSYNAGRSSASFGVK